MNDSVNGTAEEVGTDVEIVEHVPTAPSATLFRTDDPAEVIQRASQVADALKSVLDRQGLTAMISGKRHVLVEGWTTLGAMVGVTAVPVWTKPLDGTAPQGRAFGYEARVEARTLDGRVVGAADAMCTRSENRWRTADDYAIRSMAQTRATSKALRGPLGFVVTLAGYTATPGEEIGADEEPSTPQPTLPTEVADELARVMRQLIDVGVWTGQRAKSELVAHGAATTTSIREGIASLTEQAAADLAVTMREALAAASQDAGTTA